MKTYFFSLESVMEMLKECYRMGSACETGGILIQPDGHDNIITDAVSSGETAERGVATYFQDSADVDYLNKRLRKYQEQNKDFAGYFHKHPSGIKRLSHGDLNTCMEILTSENYKIDNRLVMAIITESSDQKEFPLFVYEVSRNIYGGISVDEVLVRAYPLHCIKSILINERNAHESDNSKGNRRAVNFSA